MTKIRGHAWAVGLALVSLYSGTWAAGWTPLIRVPRLAEEAADPLVYSNRGFTGLGDQG